MEGESAFLSSFFGVFRSYGIKRLVKTHSTLNLNSETIKLFPRKRVAFQCGSCDISDRAKMPDVVGCCGFFMRLLLVSPPNELPCLQVKELRLPLTSKHLIISAKEYKAAESKVIVNEGLLSPTKTTFVKNIGKNRMKLQTVRNLLADTFEGLQCSTELLHRVMKKGRDDVWGSDENESMTVFYAEGLKLCSFDSKFGLAGNLPQKHVHHLVPSLHGLNKHPLKWQMLEYMAKMPFGLIQPIMQRSICLKLGHQRGLIGVD